MAIGSFGITRPSDVRIGDIDIYYNYTRNRETSNNTMFKIDAEEVLSYTYLPDDDSDENFDDTEGLESNPDANILEGLYNLRLPSEIFDELGIYTIYIKPKMLTTIIEDCGVLSALPTVKGIVLRANNLPDDLQVNNALQGYRIEYISSDGSKLRNVVRYVTTSNRVSPITDNIGNTSQKAIRYRFDNLGTLLFLQLTPSSSSDVKPNALPYIGNPGDVIRISNTYFSPLVLEVEMVENTIDTIANIIAGEQIKDVQNGILTYYDENREITKQYNVYQIKDDVTDVPLFEVKERRVNIDENQDFDSVTEDVN
jgi:hypothetical protein